MCHIPTWFGSEHDSMMLMVGLNDLSSNFNNSMINYKYKVKYKQIDDSSARVIQWFLKGWKRNIVQFQCELF